MSSLFRSLFLSFVIIFCKSSYAEGFYVSYSLNRDYTNKIVESKENLNRKYTYDDVYMYNGNTYTGHADLEYKTNSDPGKAFTVAVGYEFDDFMIQAFYAKGNITGKTSFTGNIQVNSDKYTYADRIVHNLDYTLRGISLIGKIPLTERLDLEPEFGIARVCAHLDSNFSIKNYGVKLYDKFECGNMPKFGIGMSYKLNRNTKLFTSAAYYGNPKNSIKRVTQFSIGIRSGF